MRSTGGPQPHRPRGAPFYVRAHIALYRVTGGIIGGRGIPLRFLLLTTTGRKSGRRHTVPLPYYYVGYDGATPYVVASNYGYDQSPAWYLNLAAHPNVEVQIGREQYTARARTATPEERGRIWPRLTATRKNYARYQQGTTREIPIVLIERTP